MALEKLYVLLFPLASKNFGTCSSAGSITEIV